MRILLLADIHANWPALQAVQEPHDVCICLGDLVDYGPHPIPCVEWVRKYAHHTIRGNHDHAVAQRAAIQGMNGFRFLTSSTRELSWQLLQPKHLRYLADLPVTLHLTIAGVRFLLVHATPRDPLEEYAANDPALWSDLLRDVAADVVCVGHTHIPFVLAVDSKLVINAGSVGQPRDGDPRASYAVWEDGQAEIKRAPYPIEDVVKDVEATTLPDDVKRLAASVLRTGGRV
jgi:putative phosphoesterase